MSQSELLKRTATTLARLEIPYMVTGSLASSFQGIPRSTHDIDIVVAIQSTHANQLLAEFSPPEYYLSRDAILQAIGSAGMFNLIDLSEGYKVDFWILTSDRFDQSRFNRRVLGEVDGVEVFVSAPEDTILMKLRWGKDSGGSERQYYDAKSVFEVQHTNLDMHYLDDWANVLGLSEEWERLKREALPL